MIKINNSKKEQMSPKYLCLVGNIKIWAGFFIKFGMNNENIKEFIYFVYKTSLRINILLVIEVTSYLLKDISSIQKMLKCL